MPRAVLLVIVVPVGALGTPVTVYVPLSGEWFVELGQATLTNRDFGDYAAQGCTFWRGAGPRQELLVRMLQRSLGARL